MLTFLKLGGSLITDKTQARTPRLEVLKRLAQEIADARQAVPGLRLLLGHGSGSFGHVPARKYATRQGVHTPQEWAGFIEVWREAAALNRLVMDALAGAGLPAIAFPASGGVLADEGMVAAWELSPLRAALQAGLLPVVFGDVAFDRARGGTILSTEDLFAHLARQLRPERMLLAGIEPGVWADYPACTYLVKEITPHTLPDIAVALTGSAATDVTGGMASKVQQSLDLAAQITGLEVCIFSGEEFGLLKQALRGDHVGTWIHA
jgi:isopentenyl phosphate kinase